ncbi:MAG TPA: glutamate--tRNA ligase family protein, partial [Candidatus Dormibacteraeota bacterium]|nr:glutamate--tRNA ligase family protein [Candidatus Dormibacteraeota bacterium]
LLAAPPPRATTRFAPAPTGYLHLGHVADAIHVWGIAHAARGRVALRIEDHDRQRSRRSFETALLDDLEWLGFRPDLPQLAELRDGRSPFRQTDDDEPYALATAALLRDGLAYACDCTRSTFARWSESTGRLWMGPGCPGDCRGRRLVDEPGRTLRLDLGGGDEAFEDLLLGLVEGPVATTGDVAIRDREGNRTYNLAVVVDDIRHGVDLVVRGRDLVEATPAQIRLGRVLGRDRPPAFAHHSLGLRPDGAKLSKSDHDTGVRELRAAGWSPERVIGQAAGAVGLVEAGRDVGAEDVADLFTLPPA